MPLIDAKTAAGIPVALLAAGAAQGFSNTSESHGDLRKAENGVKQQIVENRKSPILREGKAVIELRDGTEVTINNPIVAKTAGEHIVSHAVVLGQNPDHTDPMPVRGFYKGSGNLKDGLSAKKISYSQNGIKISANQALARVTQEAISFDDNGDMAVASGQPHAGEPVAETLLSKALDE